jgi:diguanylate cyclase (GGDEF)-like protein/PAS domain S-box-containing protein
MASPVFQQQSLKFRITFTTLVIFVVSLWSLSIYASRMLRQDMQILLGQQQFASVSLIATGLNEELDDRLRALETLAAAVTPARMHQPAALQDMLEQRPFIQQLFNAGIFITDIEGTALADVPRSAGRVGVNYMDRESVSGPLKDGRPHIGRPAMGKKLEAPVFSLTVPLWDGKGQLMGVLVGTINLGLPNFLDKIMNGQNRKTGGFWLMAPQHQLFVTATDKRLTMQKLPASGQNVMLDKFREGYEGYGIALNAQGVEELTAAKKIPIAGWIMVAVLPADEAFAPIHAMQQRMWLATVLLTLLAGGFTWWTTARMLRRQLLPVLAAASAINSMADANLPPQPLPVDPQDEIAELISGFNRLLASSGQREALLKQIFDTSSVAIFLVGKDGRIMLANRRMAEMFGWPQATLDGMAYADLVHPSEREVAHQKMLALLDSQIQSVDLERRYWRVDQSEFWGHLTGQRFVDANGEDRGLVGVIADISQRRQAEIELHIVATAFESQQGIAITDTQRVILRVNKAFTDITGYTAEEAVGQNPRMLSSGRHDAAFYVAMWDSIARQGKWQGEIWNRHKNGDVFPEWLTITAVKNSAGQITHYVATFSDISDRKAAEEQIKRLAFFDPLTQLPNRRLLMDRLEQALASSTRYARKGALLFVDLDNFKTINDTLGHDKGDLLLQQVAQRLSHCTREGDTVARLGGDEFVVMLENLGEDVLEAATQAEAVGDKILAALNQPYPLAGDAHRSTPSIGITLFGDRQEGIDEPLKRADLAMYQAKAAGRNTLRFFDPQMQAVVSARAALETGLREAVTQQQFVLYYQPQVVGTHAIVGAEALVRWLHPQRGLVPPVEFIGLAEDTGLIFALGRWVLETACTQLACWATQPSMADLTLAVNVSARQFHQHDFVQQVQAVLAQTGANPHRLKLELTESLLVTHVEDVIAKMTALKQLGVGFSLDDFGTGFSSLSYLKRLPLDQLKIDQGFVRDILLDANDAAIAKMVVALADTLGLSVIAEGVETEAQRDFLAGQGCHAYQGYLCSRPLPLTDFEAFVARDSQKS